MHEDFVSEELVEFEVDGKKFKYKPATAGDELDWAPDYIETIEEDGVKKRVENIKKLSLCQLRNIFEVPYNQETIKEFIGVEKEFNELTSKEKDLFFSKMKPGIFSKLITKVKEIESGSELKKN